MEIFFMNKLLLFVASLLVVFTHSHSTAAIVQIYDHKKNVLFTVNEMINNDTNVQSLSLNAFEQGQLAYTKTDHGFYSILNIEPETQFISESEFKTYGWCFKVNNILVDTQAIDTQVHNEDTVSWFYGYAHYKNGEWTGMCLDDEK